MSSFLMVFQRIQLATADVSDKLFKAAAVLEAPVHGIVRKLDIAHLHNILAMFGGQFQKLVPREAAATPQTEGGRKPRR